MKAKKKRSPQDATLRNIRALQKRVDILEANASIIGRILRTLKDTLNKFIFIER